MISTYCEYCHQYFMVGRGSIFSRGYITCPYCTAHIPRKPAEFFDYDRANLRSRLCDIVDSIQKLEKSLR